MNEGRLYHILIMAAYLWPERRQVKNNPADYMMNFIENNYGEAAVVDGMSVLNTLRSQDRMLADTFFLWDWFNDFVIGIGNFIAGSTEIIIGILTWIIIIIGAIIGILLLVDIWSEHSFIAAALLTMLGGTILYYAFMIIIVVMYCVVSLSLAIVRYIFYDAFTLLLVIAIGVGIAWYV